MLLNRTYTRLFEKKRQSERAPASKCFEPKISSTPKRRGQNKKPEAPTKRSAVLNKRRMSAILRLMVQHSIFDEPLNETRTAHLLGRLV